MAITTPKETLINSETDPGLAAITQQDIQQITTNVADNILNTTEGRIYNQVQPVVNQITQVIQAIPGGNINGAVQLNIGGKLSADLGLLYNANTDVLTVANGIITNTVTANNFVSNGTTTLGNIGNIKITGGTYGKYITTDGTGNLNWATLEYANLQNKPILANVATSGDYNDLANRPNIPVIPSNVSSFTNDSGYITSIGTISYTDLINKPDFATVAISGDYNDLANTPNIPSIIGLASQLDVATAVSNIPWNNVSSKPNFATIATTGDYSDLANIPSIPSILGLATEIYVDDAVANLVNSAPAALNTLSELANALSNDASYSTSISTALGNRLRVDDNNQNLTTEQKANAVTNLGLANVAVSGSYIDLSDKPSIPTIPTNVSYFNNDLGYITSTDVTWTKTLGKPTFSNVAFSGDFNDLINVYGNANAAEYFTTYTGNISAGNFAGNGSNLSSLNGSNVVGDVSGANHANIADVANNVAGSNVTGQVSNALVAGTVYTNAQPNITSVGTLTSLNVSSTVDITGNLTAGNANLGNLVKANYITGTLTTNAQTNITAVGTLTGLEISGNLSAANANLGNLITANYITGTLTTASQPNITSVGTLTSLMTSGNITANNVSSNGNVSVGSNFVIYGSNNTLTTTNGSLIQINPRVDMASSLYVSGNINALLNLSVTGNVTAASLAGNGSGLTSITGANVTGVVANANYAAYAGNVVNASQPNITSVGTLTSLIVTGNIAGGNANLGNLTKSNYFSGVFDVLSNSQPNITSVGTLTSLSVLGELSVTGNTSAGNVYLSGSANIDTVVIRGESTFSNVLLTGNIKATNANLGNAITGNYFIGSGNNLSNLQFANLNISSSEITAWFQSDFDVINIEDPRYIRNRPDIVTVVKDNITLTDLGLPVGDFGQVLKSQGDGTYIFGADLTGTVTGNFTYGYNSGSTADTMTTPSGHNMFIGTTSGTLTLDRNTQENININGGNINVYVGGSTWTFDSAGVLTLPAGGDIKDSAGTSVLGGGGGGGGGSTANITFTGDNIGSSNNIVSITATNYVELNTGDSYIWTEASNASIQVGGARWTFSDPTVDGSSSNLIEAPNGVYTRSGDNVNCDPNMDTVIYASTYANQHTLKLLLCIEGIEDGQTNEDTQSCEMVVAKSIRNDSIAGTVYGLVYTSTLPLATLSARWNATTSRIEITCRPNSTTNQVVVHSTVTELSSARL